MNAEMRALLTPEARAKVDAGQTLLQEDLVGLHIKTGMEPALRYQIMVLRIMAHLATLGVPPVTTPAFGRPGRMEDGVWWFGYRHARHIPDELFLDAVRAARGKWVPQWAMVSDVQAVLAGIPLTDPYPDEFPGVPRKVILAKAKRLINRGVMDGCFCGCRGDFEIPGEVA